MNNYGFLFVHGAGLGSWIWRDVVSNLEVPYVCADFPARRQPLEARKHLSLDDYVDAVMQQAQTMAVDKIIVVGHSIGGIVALKVAEQLGNKLGGFIAVGAAIPRSGHSFLSTLVFPKNIIIRLVMRLAGTQPPASVIKSGLCNDLSPEISQEVVEAFSAESLALYRTKINVAMPTVPRLYVLLTKDNEFGVAVQKNMARTLGGATEELESGHLPMLSKPEDLTVILRAFATSL